MFFTYLRRELLGRRKQTVIVATGLGLAIALAMIMSAVAAGAKNAQDEALKGLYGVGTDVSVTQPTTSGQSGGSKGSGLQLSDSDIDANGNVDKSIVQLSPGKQTLSADDATKVSKLPGVADVSSSLELTGLTLKGSGFPTQQQQQDAQAKGAEPPKPTIDQQPPVSVLATDVASTAAGPLSSTKVESGRQLGPEDTGKANAVLDSSYANQQGLKVGDTVKLGSTDFTIVGLISPTGTTSSVNNVYIPLDQGQKISGQDGKVSALYVKANSSNDISTIKSEIESAIPGALVNTQADLASSVQGTVSSAAKMIADLGLWVSIGVLVAAFLLAILFTIQGISRRTREFGTLKSLGWRDSRVVGQVAGESVTQGLIGGVAGIIIGLVGIYIVNIMNLQIGGSASEPAPTGLADGARALKAPAASGGTNSLMALQAPISWQIILLAVALAVIGGLLAGAFGGLRASKLRPAAALRAIH